MLVTRRVHLLWQTARHLHRRQIAARLSFRAGEAWRDISPGVAWWFYRRLASRHDRPVLPPQIRSNAVAARDGVGEADAGVLLRQGLAMLNGDFAFVGYPASLGNPVNWLAPRQSRLWKYHLHQFDYLVSLSLVDDDERRMVARLVEEWIAANPIGGKTSRDAWHPFVVSVRLVNWTLALAASAGFLSDAIADSMALHSVYVQRNLEHDVGGNHLLKNLKALVFSAISTGQASKTAQAAKIFTAELNRQLLSDGCHFERTPMYHATVLTDALEVQAILSCGGLDSPRMLRDAIARMRAFLEAVTHPDGELALFKDTTLDGASTPSQIHAFAEALAGRPTQGLSTRHQLLVPSISNESQSQTAPRSALTGATSSGYFTLMSTDGRLWLLGDAGTPCPDELPAHAHADMLSYECDVHGIRLVVDSGVGEYATGPWRDYYRSTAAHNTVQIDGCDQSECWSSFRVGRRARPQDVRMRSGFAISGVDAAHTGYERLPGGVRHRRRIALVADCFYLIVDDLEGSGTHAWSSFVHAHAQASLQQHSACSARLIRDNASLSVVWAGPVTGAIVAGQREPLAGWRAERFGPPQSAATLVLTGRGILPVRIAYVLMPDADLSAARLEIERSDRLLVDTGFKKYAIELAADEWCAAPITDREI